MKMYNSFVNKSIVALIALIAAAGCSTQNVQDESQAEKKVFKWKMATSWSGGDMVTEIGPKAFAKKIALLTNDRIQVQTFPAGTLGKAFKVSGTVKNGVAAAGHTWMGYDWGRDTTTVLFGGFSGTMDTEKIIHWLYEGGGLELWQEYRLNEWDLISFPCMLMPSEVFMHSRTPVRTLADLKGLKVRTSGAWLEIVNRLGASAVTMPGAEVYTSLERGTIDATEWGSLSVNLPMGLHKIAKYLVVPGIHQPTAVGELLINKKIWEQLSDHDKKLVAEAAKMVTLEFWTKVGHRDAKALNEYKDNEIIVLSDEVQAEARKVSMLWADEKSEDNAWFKKVWEHQRNYERLWKDSSKYRVTTSYK